MQDSVDLRFDQPIEVSEAVKAKRIGRGTNVRHTATRMTVSVAVATVVTAATVMPARESTVSPDVRLAASTVCMGTAGSTCALIMGGTSTCGCKTAQGKISGRGIVAHHGATVPPPGVRARPP